VSSTGCTTEAKLLTHFYMKVCIMGESLSLSLSFTSLPQMKQKIKKLYNYLFIIMITSTNIHIYYLFIMRVQLKSCNGLKRPFLAKKSQSRDFEGSFALRAEKQF
jgi:hypothetical protein